MPTPLENYVKECGGKLNPAMNHTGTDYKGTYKILQTENWILQF